MQSTLKAIAFTFGRQGGAGLLQLVNLMLVTRLTKPYEVGQFSLGITIALLLSLVMSCGGAPALVYFVARGQIGVGLACRCVIVLTVIGTSFGAAVLGALTVFSEIIFPGLQTSVLIVAGLLLPVLLLNSLLLAILQGLQDFAAYNKALLVAPLLTIVITILMAQVIPLSGDIALAYWGLGSIGGLWVTLVMVRGHSEATDSQVATRTAVSLVLGYGWKAHLANALSFLIYRTDMIILNLFLGPTAVGAYAVATQVSERLWMFGTAVTTVVSPKLSAISRETSLETRRTIAITSAQLVAMVSLLVGVPIFFCAAEIIEVLFGSEYLAATVALKILSLSATVFSAARVFASSIAAVGRPDVTMRIAAVTFCCNLLANLWLVPLAGIAGAATATGAAYLLAVTLNVAAFSRIYQASLSDFRKVTWAHNWRGVSKGTNS